MRLTTEDTVSSVHESQFKKIDNLKRNQATGGARNDNTRKCGLTKSETAVDTSR